MEIPIGREDEINQLDMNHDEMAQTLRESLDRASFAEQKYRSLYDNAPDLLRTITTDGIIIDCNRSYATKLGYSKKEIIGASIFDHTQEEKISPLKNSFDIWKNDGVVTDKEIRMKRKNGTSLPALLSANTMYDSEGNLVVV